jgi:hypothetical protein
VSFARLPCGGKALSSTLLVVESRRLFVYRTVAQLICYTAIREEFKEPAGSSNLPDVSRKCFVSRLLLYLPTIAVWEVVSLLVLSYTTSDDSRANVLYTRQKRIVGDRSVIVVRRWKGFNLYLVGRS